MVYFISTALDILLFEPFLSGGHLAAVHDPGFRDVVFTVSLGFLLPIGLLCPLNGSSGLREPCLGVEGNSIRLVPPQWHTIPIPILKNVVSLNETVVPHSPLLVLGVAEYYSSRRVPYAGRSLQVGSKKPILWPG